MFVYLRRKKYEGKYPRQVPVANFRGNYGTIKGPGGEISVGGKVSKEKEALGVNEETEE